MYISELAKRSGATPRAIRLYEELGLLHVSRRGSYRWYLREHLDFILLIKEAQQLGVLLSELQQLVRGRHQLDWPALQQLLAHKQQQLQQQMATATAELARVIACQQQIAACLAGAGSAHRSAVADSPAPELSYCPAWPQTSTTVNAGS